MMRYEDYVDSKTIRNILKEVFPEVAPSNAMLIANSRARVKKMLISMEIYKHIKLNNEPIVLV